MTQATIKSVFLIISTKTHLKGTGFLITSGHIITNWHVIKDSRPTEVLAISSNGKKVQFQNIISDMDRDLTILEPIEKQSEGLKLIDQNINVGKQVSTWGHPLGYSGPAPILCVGYLAGFREHQKDTSSKFVKHYIVNAAFNPGNSGGPLFISGDNKVVGVVVAKHAPITPFLASAIDELSRNRSGIVFTAKDENGNQQQYVESQVVAMVLSYFRDMTQVVIGEAIVGAELFGLLKENRIDF